MFRLFHDNNIDFLGHKAVFIMISVVLMVIGCVGVVARGFNLGVDFAGGSLYYVQFVNPKTAPNDIRSALSAQGIDAQKVTIQPISSGGRTGVGQGLLVRLPADVGTVDETTGIGNQKRIVMKALSSFNATQTNAPGKSDVNLADEAEIFNELTLAGIAADGGATPEAIATAIVAHRNSQPKGVYATIEDVRQAPNVSAASADAIVGAFYAGKSDINQIGGDDFLNLMMRMDPLGLKGDAAAATAQYTALRDTFIGYRDRTLSGVVSSIDEIPFGEVAPQFREAINSQFFVGAFNMTNAESVGAQVGDDLRNRAIYVTLASLVGMLVFIAFRFEWIYGVSAVLAVFHDVPVTLGIFALFGWEINLTVIAAILTLIGYSTNDTIVIFDRIRETLRAQRRDSIEKVTNDAINATLSRTVIASGTAFLTVFVLVLFGGDVLRSFAMVLLIGIVVGPYSSIGIASPIMIWLNKRQRASLPASVRATADAAAAEPSARAARTAKTI